MERKSSLRGDKKRDVVNRLRSARGHLDGIIKMVEDDTYCVDVIKQVSAVRGALDRVNRIELTNHVEHCFVEQIQGGDREGAISEIVEILGLRTEIA